MQDKLADGDTMKRLQQEEKAMNKYIQKKELHDKMDDENRKKNLKHKENEMKRILDIQLKEKEDKIRLRKFEENTEARIISKDVEDFNSTLNKKKQDYLQRVMHHNEKLVSQIEEKKQPKAFNPKELLMNKKLILEIQAQKAQMC